MDHLRPLWHRCRLALAAMAAVSSAGTVAVAFEFDEAVNDGGQIRVTWFIPKGG